MKLNEKENFSIDCYFPIKEKEKPENLIQNKAIYYAHFQDIYFDLCSVFLCYNGNFIVLLLFEDYNKVVLDYVGFYKFFFILSLSQSMDSCKKKNIFILFKMGLFFLNPEWFILHLYCFLFDFALRKKCENLATFLIVCHMRYGYSFRLIFFSKNFCITGSEEGFF